MDYEMRDNIDIDYLKRQINELEAVNRRLKRMVLSLNDYFHDHNKEQLEELLKECQQSIIEFNSRITKLNSMIYIIKLYKQFMNFYDVNK